VEKSRQKACFKCGILAKTFTAFTKAHDYLALGERARRSSPE